MVIQHNMMAFNANRQYGINVGKSRKLTEKLSSGYRINRAADDAAGLAISEKMRRMIRGLGQSADNIQDGIGFVQTADGALNEAHDILQRMNELAVKSANGTNTEDDRQYIDSEVQQLKTELNRIFETTSFNDKRIWSTDNAGRKKVGEEIKQAVEFTMGRNKIDITNENCGVLACDVYQIKADRDGIWVEWTGYDKNRYVTSKVDWATLKKNKYSFEMSDYFNNPKNVDQSNQKINDALFDANGKALFSKEITLSVQESASIDDMIAAIDGTGISTYASTPMTGQIEWVDGTWPAGQTPTVGVSASLYPEAAYVSHSNSAFGYDYTNTDYDEFMKPAYDDGTVLSDTSTIGNVNHVPAATDVTSARQNDEQWEVTFYVEGIGKVTGKSISVSYGAYLQGNFDSSTRGLWWDVNSEGREYAKEYSVYEFVRDGSGSIVGQKATLEHAMEALTGDRDDTYDQTGVANYELATPGLLSSANHGCGVSSGWIRIGFALESEDVLPYGDNETRNKSKAVGSFSVTLYISDTDTEEQVLEKIQDALSDKTILDFQRTKSNAEYPDYQEFHKVNANARPINVPIWGATNQFFVQAGTEAGEHISVNYEALNVAVLGMQHTNVLTVEDSEKAINEIKGALQMVSTQRSDFGAYQNRLEHAVNANENTEENTQAAESVIRDTDMAKTMVEYSNNNILLQAGQAMMAQANQSNQAILALLQ